MNENGWMACLDVQTHCRDGEIDYKFFQKTMVNRRGMPNKSAMPFNIKRASASEQGICRQRNTRRALPDNEEVIADMLTDFSRDLKFFESVENDQDRTRTTLKTFFSFRLVGAKKLNCTKQK